MSDVVILTLASWNQIREWLRRLDAIQRVAAGAPS
jgi:hypothetical protein